jgi:hypothetical protein
MRRKKEMKNRRGPRSHNWRDLWVHLLLAELQSQGGPKKYAVCEALEIIKREWGLDLSFSGILAAAARGKRLYENPDPDQWKSYHDVRAKRPVGRPAKQNAERDEVIVSLVREELARGRSARQVYEMVAADEMLGLGDRGVRAVYEKMCPKDTKINPFSGPGDASGPVDAVTTTASLGTILAGENP